MLACVLLAVAAAPATSSESVLSRPVAALVLRVSSAEVRADASVAPAERRVALAIAPAIRVEPRERLVHRRVRARARADERYLYLMNSTFLC